MYWYISRTKVDTLVEATKRGGTLQTIGVKVKSPLLEVGGDVAFNDGLHRRLRRVRKRLDTDPSIRPFDELGSDPGPLFAFEGQAARAFDGEEGYLLALAGPQTALILAGARWHVLGQQRDQGVHVGGSGDPIAMVTDAFALGRRGYDDDTVFEADLLAGVLSRTWRLVMARNGQPSAVLPRVRGVALFAGLYPTTPHDVGFVDPAITRLVVGSPVYVEQV